MRYEICLAVSVVALGACKPDSDQAEEDVHVALSGSLEKGPFVVGSTVSVSPVDASFQPTGQVYNTQILDNLGSFGVEFDYLGDVALEGTGYYYNEVTGELSTAPLTLRAFHTIAASGDQSAYVNVLTHLSTLRIQVLLADGSSFDDAQEQAESELRAALNVGLSGFDPGARAIEMSILGGDTDANAYLLAVSSVVTQAAALRSDSVDANLQELLNSISVDFADDGTITADLVAELDAAQLELDSEAVMEALQQRLDELGSTAVVPDIDLVLDQDQDGYVNSEDCRPVDPERWTGNADLDGDGHDHGDCGGADCDDDDASMGDCAWEGMEVYEYGWGDYGERNCYLHFDVFGALSDNTGCADCTFVFDVHLDFVEDESFDDGWCSGLDAYLSGDYTYGLVEEYYWSYYGSSGYYPAWVMYYGGDFAFTGWADWDDSSGHFRYWQGYLEYPWHNSYYTSYLWGEVYLDYWY